MSPVGTLKLETNICIFLNTDLGASQMALVVTGYIWIGCICLSLEQFHLKEAIF